MRGKGWLGSGLAAILAAGLIPGGAWGAEPPVTVYYRAGAWRAFDGKNSQGQLICGMASEAAPDGRQLSIRRVIGGNGLMIYAAKPSWNIPPGTTIPASLQVGSETQFTVQGSGQANEVAFPIAPDQVVSFMGAFRSGEQMALSFPAGNEPPWTLSLAGSDAVNHTFERCITDLSARAGVPVGGPPFGPEAPGTQPFGQAPTQPFGQAPTQPVGQAAAAPPPGQPVTQPPGQPPNAPPAGVPLPPLQPPPTAGPTPNAAPEEPPPSPVPAPAPPGGAPNQ